MSLNDDKQVQGESPTVVKAEARRGVGVSGELGDRIKSASTMWFPAADPTSENYEINAYIASEPDRSHEEIKLLGDLHTLLGSVDVAVNAGYKGIEVGELVKLYSILYHEYNDQLNNRDRLNLEALGFQGIVPGVERRSGNRDITLAVKLMQHNRKVLPTVVKDHPVYVAEQENEED